MVVGPTRGPNALKTMAKRREAGKTQATRVQNDDDDDDDDDN